MDRVQIEELLAAIMNDYGVPKRIRETIEDSLTVLNAESSDVEKIGYIVSILDEVSANPNLTTHARTQIWNAVSTLETIKQDV